MAASYARARQVPDTQVLALDAVTDAIVTREVYQQSIERPIVAWLRENEAFDRIHVIVLAPGLPLRIAGTAGRTGTAASVDSELAVLYRRLTGASVPLVGFIDNPYFSAGPLDAPRPFDRAEFDIYLVTRLDGRSEADALGLIERGKDHATDPVFVIDGRPSEASGVEARWLADVAPRVRAVQPAARIVSDASFDVVRGVEDVTAYASWGSNDARQRVPPVRFGAAAIAASFMSSDARTFAAPPQDWQPGTWGALESFFAGTPEALAADWLNAGLTGLGAQVSEPYLDGAFRPATLMEAWARGYTLAESFYLALPYLSWQSVVFGDPLARATDATPEPSARPTAPGAEPPFVERAASVLRQGAPELGDDAARLMARANLSIARGQAAEAAELLEQVTVLAPRYVPGHVSLGQAYDAVKRYDLAKARYELVLGLEPAHVVALNNLAYTMGVHLGQPKDALPVAERAGALASNSPAVLDTLGWTRHLAGDSRGALAPLRRAVELAPTLCEAWSHLAEVEKVAGTPAGAKQALERASTCGKDGSQSRP